ncbi:MAG TPA: ArsI/CadI family heavy metal resistance metalloenzyme [Burkholderiales bacterium]|jgi:catechol 2,3-dioxygenase-like lactoylglutathione lyase family enzyme|nr:ArsI/CadI family heavy metal resistance metalloenzyme [Burkholderiales bacterium]
MKRMHVHVAVSDLDASVGFYSKLFGAQPSVLKPDYAKWTLEDPRVNFAISSRGLKPGLDHLGIQVESDNELTELHDRLEAAGQAIFSQENTTCCYARSDKHWVTDPQGIAWEAFHTLEGAPTYGAERKPGAEQGACCAPAPQTVRVAGRREPAAALAGAADSRCC